MLSVTLLIIPTKSSSEQLQPESKFSHEETTNLGAYIRRCEIDRQTLDGTTKLLTDCEFRNQCSMKWTPLFMGFLAGAAVTFIYERGR